MIDRDLIGDSKYEELKRADHLIYVTLKYTRTVDVMKNIIKRLITAMDFAVSDALLKYKTKKSIVGLVLFKQLVAKKPKLKKYLTFYIMLKRIDKSKFSGREEYRKNVTLIAGKKEVNFEMIKEYFERTKEFVKLLA